MASYPPPTELLPHTGRAVLIDAIVDNTDTGATAIATITPAHPYFVAGRGVPAWAGIEIMAQAIAAHAALCGCETGAHAPRRGMLLGTRHYDGHVPWFAEGTRLIIRADRHFAHDGGMSACECRIDTADRTLAEATIIILEEIDS